LVKISWENVKFQNFKIHDLAPPSSDASDSAIDFSNLRKHC